MASQSAGGALKGVIALTQAEKSLFELLLKVRGHHGLQTTLRVAGGWVRDKYLGRESDDIDIALDDMMGCAYAEKVNEYLKQQGSTEHKIAKIQSNPDQSKHLETARIKVEGVWIDLVNLRNEKYTEESRIPEMTLGTASEDAYRRDFTINAMFYNINEDTLEDLTGRGVQDLKEGVIRTPLPASETFKDDPLRVMRAVRFAARFNYRVDDQVLSAAQDPAVHHLLGSKISKERIGQELVGLLHGPNPVFGMMLIELFGIGDIIFSPPGIVAGTPKSHLSRYRSSLLMDEYGPMSPKRNELMCGDPSYMKYSGDSWDQDEKRLAFLTAHNILWAECTYEEKKKTHSVLKFIIGDSIKLRLKDATDAVALASASAGFQIMIKQMQDNGANDIPRLQAGLIVREAGPMWRVALGLAFVRMVQAVHTTTPELKPFPIEQPMEDRYKPLADIVLTTKNLLIREKLDQAWGMKPILNGGDLIKAGVPKGPKVSEFTEMVLHWQLEHPDYTKDDHLQLVKSRMGETSS